MRGAGEASLRGAAGPRVLLGLLALKAYGLLVLYVLFLGTPARERIEESFLFVEEGGSRAGRVEAIEAGFWPRLAPFDGQWYLDIAAKGYRRLASWERREGRFPAGNYAFFPRLPTLLRALRALVPGAWELGSVVVVLLSALGAWVAWRLAAELGIRPAVVVALLFLALQVLLAKGLLGWAFVG